jgi:hypothetical protein
VIGGEIADAAAHLPECESGPRIPWIELKSPDHVGHGRLRIVDHGCTFQPCLDMGRVCLQDGSEMAPRTRTLPRSGRLYAPLHECRDLIVSGGSPDIPRLQWTTPTLAGRSLIGRPFHEKL